MKKTRGGLVWPELIYGAYSFNMTTPMREPVGDVRSLSELVALEDRIRRALQPHTLDAVLHGLWNTADSKRLPAPFMVAGTVLFALRHCAPAFRSMRAAQPSWADTASMMRNSNSAMR